MTQRRYTFHSLHSRISRLWVAALLIVGLSVVAASCDSGSSPAYSRFVGIDPDGWENSEYCVYRMTEGDSLALAKPGARFDLIVTVRHTTAYPYNNLWIVLEKSSPTDSLSTSGKVNLRLADTSGSWLGHGMQGLYEFSDTVMRGVAMSPMDILSVRHDMPESSLPGILDMGITVVPSR